MSKYDFDPDSYQRRPITKEEFKRMVAQNSEQLDTIIREQEEAKKRQADKAKEGT